MKKLILSAAIVLGSIFTMSAQAQVQDQNILSAEQNIAAEVATSTTGYVEIKTEEVLTAVTESLTKSFPDAVITKAFVNENSEYKLEAKVGDKEEIMFADATGRWMELEQE